LYNLFPLDPRTHLPSNETDKKHRLEFSDRNGIRPRGGGSPEPRRNQDAHQSLNELMSCHKKNEATAFCLKNEALSIFTPKAENGQESLNLYTLILDTLWVNWW
jgi:hypothetical protein